MAVYGSGLVCLQCVLKTVLFPAVIFQLMLREAHESIADKDSLIEDNERMMKFLNEEKEDLARENQVRLDPVKIIKGALCVVNARLIACFSSLRISKIISRSCAELMTSSTQRPLLTQHTLTPNLAPTRPLEIRLSTRNKWRRLGRLVITCMRTYVSDKLSLISFCLTPSCCLR